MVKIIRETITHNDLQNNTQNTQNGATRTLPKTEKENNSTF